nr:exodeoxyribonuclease I [Betaproteobacteria bacterium]
TSEQTERWKHFRHQRLTQLDGGNSITLKEYTEQINLLRTEKNDNTQAQNILHALDAWRNLLLNS